MVEIPTGLTTSEEWTAVRKMQGREVKGALIEWVMGMADWDTKADLTFSTLAHPETAEKRVKRWLRQVAPGASALVGYERQQRGAIHLHVVVSGKLDRLYAEAVWNKMAGWCRIEAIDDPRGALAYCVKHAVKDLDIDLLGPISERLRYANVGGRYLPGLELGASEGGASA